MIVLLLLLLLLDLNSLLPDIYPLLQILQLKKLLWFQLKVMV